MPLMSNVKTESMANFLYVYELKCKTSLITSIKFTQCTVGSSVATAEVEHMPSIQGIKFI